MDRAGRVAHRRGVPREHHPDVPLDHELPRPFVPPRAVPDHLTVLDRAALAGPTLDVARALIGTRLVRSDGAQLREGRIVEVEAYIGEDDRASHARFGRTARNAVMFGPPGIAYVYLVYGMYDCLNVVTEPAGRPAAVLIRAVEPLSGIDAMRAGRRGILRRRKNIAVGEASSAAVRDRVARIPAHRLASGPGLVAAAFGIDRSWTGTDLCDAGSALRLERGPADKVPPEDIVATPRIGVGYAGPEWAARPWRFAIAGHRSVSVPRAAR